MNWIRTNTFPTATHLPQPSWRVPKRQ